MGGALRVLARVYSQFFLVVDQFYFYSLFLRMAKWPCIYCYLFHFQQ